MEKYRRLNYLQSGSLLFSTLVFMTNCSNVDDTNEFNNIESSGKYNDNTIKSTKGGFEITTKEGKSIYFRKVKGKNQKCYVLEHTACILNRLDDGRYLIGDTIYGTYSNSEGTKTYLKSEEGTKKYNRSKTPGEDNNDGIDKFFIDENKSVYGVDKDGFIIEKNGQPIKGEACNTNKDKNKNICIILYNGRYYKLYDEDYSFSKCEDCSICCSEFNKINNIDEIGNIAVMACNNGHIFHLSCIDLWVRSRGYKCPLCQGGLPTPKEESMLDKGLLQNKGIDSFKTYKIINPLLSGEFGARNKGLIIGINGIDFEVGQEILLDEKEKNALLLYYYLGEMYDNADDTDINIEIREKSSDSKQKWDLRDMFIGNYHVEKLHITLPKDINIIGMSGMFIRCRNLKELSGISKWNTSKVTDMSHMFCGCKSLISLPDISNWDTSKVTDMSYMFDGCESLISLPDLSNWNTSKVTDMSYMFCGCKSLISLPDISNWDTSKVAKMWGMFDGCESLLLSPDISKWNTSKVTNMKYMFNKCKSLISLPDLSKWKTGSVTSMAYMFEGCESLMTLLGLSEWDTRSLIDIDGMFDGCNKLVNKPDIKLNTIQPTETIIDLRGGHVAVMSTKKKK